MKNLLALAVFSCCFSALQAQYTIPDANFAAKLQQIVPNAMSGNVLDETHPEVLVLNTMNVSNSGINDIDGVQFFVSLSYLYCYSNQLTSLPTLPSSLEKLNCIGNELTSLPTLPNSLLDINCGFNQLTSLPTLPSSLEKLHCNSNELTSLPTLPNSLLDIYSGFNQLTSLPMLPGSLWRLDCPVNFLGSLPALPNSLELLDCGKNQITALPTLPNILVWLRCDDNPITVLPSLPNTLQTLDCDECQISALPLLPNNLVQLRCRENMLTSLPTLPNTLEILFCGDNQLSSLPVLPDSLYNLICNKNLLTSLPVLPSGLTALYCQENQLTGLPDLPDSLYRLECFDNQINCLPPLPSSLNILKSYDNFIDCLPNFPPNLPPFGQSWYQSDLGFTLTLCSPSSPCYPPESIVGNIFNDANGNGQLDTGEQPFLNGVAEAQPGNYLSGADVNGNYLLPVAVGSYSVQGQPVLYHNFTTPVHNVSIAMDQIDSLNHIGYQIIPGVYDLVVDIHASPARPGFDNNVFLQVQNIGTETTTAAVNFDLDLDQTWVNSSITPDTQNGNNATWSVPMNPGDTWNTTITLNTATGIALGTPIDHLLSATPTQADTTPGDNIEAWNDVVVGSYDPNDKIASPSSMTPTQVQSGEYIEYTIRFQNTGTAPAETVQITDTLSNDVQWNTIQVISSSHSNFWYQSDGVLHFIHNNINLPDSTSDEPNSHGFVKFRIKPVNTLMAGDEVENTANIYFDFNEPVITDPALFEVTIPTEIAELEIDGLKMWPNPPVNGSLWLLLADAEASTIEIRDLTGKVVSAQRTNGTREQLLDVSKLVSGVYFVRVSNVNGIRSGRFVKL